MNKAELESKSLSDLHGLAAAAGIERYRMLPRPELVAKLADGEGGSGNGGRSSQRAPRSDSGSGEQRERPPRRRRSRGGRKPTSGGEGSGREGAREPRSRPQPPARPEPAAEAPAAPSSGAAPAEPSRPRRRRRRFGRRGKQGIGIQDLLLPPEAGRQAILCAETREACTELLRGVAGDIAADSKGPDPVVLLIDPSPEELADWKRVAPQAEIVAAGQARHASDALAQAKTRAGNGDAVILLVDSLTRLAEAYGDADSAKEFFDAGRAQGGAGGGSLTVVVALERSAQG